MLAWLPIVGPIVEGVISLFNKRADVSLQRQVDDNKTDVAIIQTRAQVAIAFKDDLGVRLLRDCVMFPVAVWVLLVSYYNCFHNILPAGWTWTIMDYPQGMQYIPYAVIAFLFVNSLRK